MPHAIPRKVYLPKFTLRMRKGLNEPLKALGLNAMFEAGRANFSEMVAGGGIFVSDTLHEAMIEVRQCLACVRVSALVRSKVRDHIHTRTFSPSREILPLFYPSSHRQLLL